MGSKLTGIFWISRCRDWTGRVGYCDDAAVADGDSWEDTVRSSIRKYSDGKKYDIGLKPLFSAFRPRAIGATTVRAVLVNYLPLLEAYMQPEDDESEEDRDRPARPSMDSVVPLKRSVAHILREVRLRPESLYPSDDVQKLIYFQRGCQLGVGLIFRVWRG